MTLTKRVLAGLVLALLLALPRSAAADTWFGGEYSYSGTQCSKISDPVDTVFYGSGATGDYLTRDGKGHIYYHTGWSDHSGEDDQSYQSSSPGLGCTLSLARQPAEHFGFPNSRYHMRLFDPQVKDRKGRSVRVATTHHEDWVQSCGWHGNHAIDKGAKDRGKAYETDKGSGFDQGRRKLATRFSKDPKGSGGRHPIRYVDWGNTRSMKQCDGEWAGSNGLAVYIGVGKI